MLLWENTSPVQTSNSIWRRYKMCSICNIRPTTIREYNCGRWTSATSGWFCKRFVNGATTYLHEITYPRKSYIRYGNSALFPSHNTLAGKGQTYFLSEGRVQRWYSEIQSLYFCMVLDARFCRTQTTLSVTAALLILLTFIHGSCNKGQSCNSNVQKKKYCILLAQPSISLPIQTGKARKRGKGLYSASAHSPEVAGTTELTAALLRTIGFTESQQ